MRDESLVVVPTLNAGLSWSGWIEAFDSATLKPDCLVIDSSSSDGTVELARASGYRIECINREEFNHGGTRNYALELYGEKAFIVFLTQDAILADPGSIENILKPFSDKSVAAVCGRQLPRQGAGAIETHARLYNYPEQSRVVSLDDAPALGLKTAFLSNSFAAYRVSVLKEIGGFPASVIFGEDMYVAAQLLKAGYKVAYAADARVYHSHDYTVPQEFRRYFDMGIFHAAEPWIMREFGSAGRAGAGFIRSSMTYLWHHAPWRIPESLVRAALAYLGFRLGLLERWLPKGVKRVLSMNSGYFGR